MFDILERIGSLLGLGKGRRKLSVATRSQSRSSLRSLPAVEVTNLSKKRKQWTEQ